MRRGSMIAWLAPLVGACGLVLAIATSIDAGESHTCAVVDTGGVWCWGLNASGQLGNGGTAMTGPPGPVMGLHDAVAVAGGRDHTCALRATGAIVCWGDNRNGQLGDGTIDSPRTTPTEVVFP